MRRRQALWLPVVLVAVLVSLGGVPTALAAVPTFATAVNYAVHASGQPQSVAVGDLNRDGAPDLVVANENTDDVSVLLGAGDGTFGTAVNYAAHNAPVAVAIGDLNGDGKPDLAVGNTGVSNDVSILLG